MVGAEGHLALEFRKDLIAEGEMISQPRAASRKVGALTGTVGTLQRIAQALGVPVAELLE